MLTRGNAHCANA